MGKRRETIGRQELRVLRYIADHHPVSAGEVARCESELSGKARTTVLTMLERLRKKGYLSRRKIGGVYQYSPKSPKPVIFDELVRDFVESVLDGSVMPFVAYMTREADITDEELGELKRLVREIEQRRKRGQS